MISLLQVQALNIEGGDQRLGSVNISREHSEQVPKNSQHTYHYHHNERGSVSLRPQVVSGGAIASSKVR
jgi:hypothetical protein